MWRGRLPGRLGLGPWSRVRAELRHLDVGLGFPLLPLRLDRLWMHLLHGHTSSHLEPTDNQDTSQRC